MDQVAALANIAHDFYRREWARRPSYGSRAGLVEFDDQLEVPTAGLVADEIADLTATRRQIEAMAEPEPATLAWLDRQSLLAHLEQEILSLTQIQHWRTDPV